MSQAIDSTRRRFFCAAASAFGLAMVSGARAAELMLTPPQSRGPFYPLQLPLDKYNDLIKVEGRAGLAKGEISNVAGRVLDEKGRPLKNARIEIWQCDANGRYHHPWDRRSVDPDPDFQGYGQFVTGEDGAYRFRTIKPVAYPGRAPHIHFAISGPEFEPLITQMYVAGAPENERDFLLNAIHDPKARQSVIVAFEPIPGEAELLANFDIVLAADGRFSG